MLVRPARCGADIDNMAFLASIENRDRAKAQGPATCLRFERIDQLFSAGNPRPSDDPVAYGALVQGWAR